jgi:hypothetical protein
MFNKEDQIHNIIGIVRLWELLWYHFITVPVPTFWQITVPVPHGKKLRFLRFRFRNTALNSIGLLLFVTKSKVFNNSDINFQIRVEHKFQILSPF